ncbi:hypothetical protein EVAR_46796_1 [Eumeta japonica]|uniref:Uncharacterized protein n=1 Tax=Eumeta variegata TaxID=151549 RepID=A0A4C1XG09_EUMVA|nr:hypothetical protein EVAR_46796_1 [Eumeta japonica]
MEWQTRVRYLAVQIDHSMRMAFQVEHVIHQSRNTLSMLRPVLRSSPMNSFALLHQCTRGRQSADLSQDNSSIRPSNPIVKADQPS